MAAPVKFQMTNADAIRGMACAIQTPGVVLAEEKLDASGNVVRRGRQPLGLPVLLWGPPGVAKTAFVSMIAKALDYHLVTVLASLREPSDFLGLPLPNQVQRQDPATGGLLWTDAGGNIYAGARRQDRDRPVMGTEVRMAPPDWAIELNAHSDNPRPGDVGNTVRRDANGDEMMDDFGNPVPVKRALLFLDEFTTAPKSVQAALLRVVHERVVGDVELNSNVAVIAAANPPFMSPGGEGLEPPTANRFIHLDWKPIERDQWADYIEGKKSTVQIPRIPDRQAFDFQWNHVRALGAGFIRSFRQPTALTAAEKKGLEDAGEYKHYFPLFQMPEYQKYKNIGKSGRDGFDPIQLAWPSPRSWELALRAAAGTMAASATDVTNTLMCGAIGFPLCQQFGLHLKKIQLRPAQDYISGGAEPHFSKKNMSEVSVMLTAITDYGLTAATAPQVTEWLWSYADVNHAEGWPINFFDRVILQQYNSWRNDPERGGMMRDRDPAGYAQVVAAWEGLERRVRAQVTQVVAGSGVSW